MIKKIKLFLSWIILNRTVVYHLIVLFFVILSSFFALLFSKLYWNERDEFLNYRKRVITAFEGIHKHTLENQDTLKLNQDSLKNWIKANSK